MGMTACIAAGPACMHAWPLEFIGTWCCWTLFCWLGRHRAPGDAVRLPGAGAGCIKQCFALHVALPVAMLAAGRAACGALNSRCR